MVVDAGGAASLAGDAERSAVGLDKEVQGSLDLVEKSAHGACQEAFHLASGHSGWREIS